MNLRWGLVLCLTLFMTACGYTFEGTWGEPPGGIRSVTVPTVRNSSTYTDLTSDLTNELIRQFNINKTIETTNLDMAEAVLDVYVRAVQIEGAARTRSEDNSATRKVTVEAEAVLSRKASGRVLWRRDRIVSTNTYAVAEDQSLLEANLTAALRDAADDIAEKIHNGLFENF